MVSTAGTYSVTVTTPTTCVNADTITLTFGTGLTVNLGNDTALCSGASVTLNAGNSGASYTWSTGASTQSITVASPGTYSVTVSNGACSATDTLVVSTTSPPVVTNYTTCAGYTVLAGQGLQAANNCTVGQNVVTSFSGVVNSSDPTYHRSFSGTTYGASGASSAVFFDAITFTVATTGSYTFDMCSTDFDAFLSLYSTSFNPTTPAINFVEGEDAGATCTNGGRITQTLTAGTTYILVPSPYYDGDSGAYTITFTGPGAVSATAQAPLQWYTAASGGSPIGTGNTFNPVGAAGSGLANTNTPGVYNYYVACASSPGCRSLATFTINASPVVNLGPDTSSCGGTITLNAGNPGAIYAWSNAATTQTIAVSTTGNYKVTVTNSGCTATDSITVTFNSPPVIASVTASPSSICTGDSSQLLVTATTSGGHPALYAWSQAGTLSASNIANPVARPTGTTLYRVTVTDGATGCTATGAVPVTVNQLPTVNLGRDTTICSGTLTLNAGTPGATYAWSNETTAQTTTVSTTDVYSVTVTNASGCKASDTISVTVGSPAVNLGNDTTLCANSFTLNAGNAGATFHWSDNSSNQTLTVTQSGTYSVTVTVAGGCSATDAIVITLNSTPVVSLAPVTQCGGMVTLDAGNAGATYHWSDNSTAQTLMVMQSGTYGVTVSNGSCSAVASSVVTINTPPTVNLGNDTTVCDMYTLNAGNAGATFHWSDNSTGQTLMVMQSGTYAVTVTGSNGCTAADNIQVTVNTAPTVSLPANVSQCGGTYTLNAGNAGATYHWSDNSSNQTLVVTQSGTYSVTVTTGGCSSNASSVVDIKTVPVVTLGNDTALCSGMIDLNAGNTGATYHWSDNSTNQILMVMQSGTYGVTVTGSNNCTASDAIVVSIGSPVVNLGPNVSVCAGTPVTLDAANPGATYLWSDQSTGQTLSPTANGTYSVTVTYAGGCSATGSVLVTFNPSPVVNLGNDTAICGGTLTLDAGNTGSTFLWSNQSTSQTLVASASGTYGVTVTTGSCTASDAIQVTVNGTAIVNLGNDTILCGNSLVLNSGVSGSTYQWSDNSTAQSLTVTTSGQYSVTVTVPGGCSAADTINVVFNAAPAVILGNDTTICGSTLTLNAGNPGATYLWSTGAITQSIDVTTSGTYGVAVTSGGCAGVDTIRVTFGAITVNLGPDQPLHCSPDTLDAGNQGATYIWSTGATTQTIVTPQNVNEWYSVTVTSNGCTGVDSILIGCEGIEELAFGSVQLYPNPNEGQFNLVMEQSTITDLNIEIVAVTGQKVWSIEHQNAVGKYVREFNLNYLAKGVYYVRLVSGNDVTVKRIVLQ